MSIFRPGVFLLLLLAMPSCSTTLDLIGGVGHDDPGPRAPYSATYESVQMARHYPIWYLDVPIAATFDTALLPYTLFFSPGEFWKPLHFHGQLESDHDTYLSVDFESRP